MARSTSVTGTKMSSILQSMMASVAAAVGADGVTILAQTPDSRERCWQSPTCGRNRARGTGHSTAAGAGGRPRCAVRGAHAHLQPGALLPAGHRVRVHLPAGLRGERVLET